MLDDLLGVRFAVVRRRRNAINANRYALKNVSKSCIASPASDCWPTSGSSRMDRATGELKLFIVRTANNSDNETGFSLALCREAHKRKIRFFLASQRQGDAALKRRLHLMLQRPALKSHVADHTPTLARLPRNSFVRKTPASLQDWTARGLVI